MSVLDEFEIDDKLNCITTDSASNNTTMVKELEIRLGERGIIWPWKERHLPCITHVINIAVDEFIKLIKTGPNGEGTANSDGIDLARLLSTYEQLRSIFDRVLNIGSNSKRFATTSA